MKLRTHCKHIVAEFFLLLLFFADPACAMEEKLWNNFLSDFVTKDGRVIDYIQDDVSHSEGQAYAMLLALSYNDKESFKKLWEWTRNNIGVRKDNLFAWAWGKRPDGRWAVRDDNNATDGDILIAYALLKAGKRWNVEEYTFWGNNTARAIRGKLAFSWQGHSLLLPGIRGFTDDNSIFINPSYFIMPAFRFFAIHDEKIFWEKVYKDSLSIIGKATFGQWGLPADWLRLDNSGMSPDFNKSPYFGYEAVRILLYLSFEADPVYPEGLNNIFSFYQKQGYIPLRVDLERDSVSMKPGSAGFYATYALAAERSGKVKLSKKLYNEAKALLEKEKKSYYSYVLYLLASRKNLFE